MLIFLLNYLCLVLISIQLILSMKLIMSKLGMISSVTTKSLTISAYCTESGVVTPQTHICCRYVYPSMDQLAEMLPGILKQFG